MRPLDFDRCRFGADIRSARKAKDMSLRDMPPETGLSYKTVEKIENGKWHLPGAAILLAVWADLDLRRYVKKNLVQERTKRGRG